MPGKVLFPEKKSNVHSEGGSAGYGRASHGPPASPKNVEKMMEVKAVQFLEAFSPLSYPTGGFKMVAGRAKGKILVVDDEETIGIGISEILKDEGFEAAYVINGKDAVEAVKGSGFNLVFMDMIMPGMNGLDTYREIKKYRPDTKVVLFTGYFRDAEDVISQGIKEGMIDEFIRKPYFADEIIRSARKYV